MAPEIAADSTVTQLMLGGSAVRHLAHHLLGLNVTVTLDALTSAPGPGIRVLLHGETSGANVSRVADSLGLGSPDVDVDVRGDHHYEVDGAWRGYQVRVAAVVPVWAVQEASA